MHREIVTQDCKLSLSSLPLSFRLVPPLVTAPVSGGLPVMGLIRYVKPSYLSWIWETGSILGTWEPIHSRLSLPSMDL